MSEEQDTPSSVEVPAPTEPGFYVYSGGRQSMLFLLKDVYGEGLRWAVYNDSGDYAPCEWPYIEQALGVHDLLRLDDVMAPKDAKKPRRNSPEDKHHRLESVKVARDIPGITTAKGLVSAAAEIEKFIVEGRESEDSGSMTVINNYSGGGSSSDAAEVYAKTKNAKRYPPSGGEGIRIGG